MTLDELQALYRANQLVEAVAEPFGDEHQAWIVEFRHVGGGFVLLTEECGKECCYHDLSHASESALQVGFKQLRVESQIF